MDFFTKQGIVYALLLLPTFFAAAIFSQGVTKLSREDESGKTGIGFGIFLFVVIVAAYFLFIR
jgi:hypothetical protein